MSIETPAPAIHYLADAAPEPGRAVEVAPGILWLRMPLPFALNHVNVWAIDDVVDGRAGWTLVDTGIGFEPTREAWLRAFDGALAGRPIVRVICTHMHPDHVGLAGWFCERFACELSMTQGEYLLMRLMAQQVPGITLEQWRDFYVANGLGADAATIVSERTDYYRRAVGTPPSTFNRLDGGQRVPIGGHPWRVILGYGHSCEHAALYSSDRNLLISGDMLLPRISTNVSVHPLEPRGDPLGGFLASIAEFRALPADVMVLPSHGLPFGRDASGGAHARVDQLEAHHAARLAEVETLAAQRPDGISAADVIPVMWTRALDMHQMGFATGEALAHLHWHWHRGTLERTVDAAGVFRFRRV
ncbi:MBL fold metallo-hydrolase [soil metagenome]